MKRGPLRRVVKYAESSGTMHLECGHLAAKRPGNTHPMRTRCGLCREEEIDNTHLPRTSRLYDPYA